MEKRKKVLISLAALALILVIAVIAVHFLGKGRISATTMRLLRIEGEVSLESGGKTKKIVDNLRLASGDILSTKSNSLASIALDDSKAVTLQEQSSAEFKQNGKKLELNLTAGSLFFEVSKKLKDDESFEIRTSTMMVGIRGTSGYVYVQKDGKDGILLTDGEVEVEGYNPKTGERKTKTVKAGQMVYVYLFDEKVGKSVEFELYDITEEQLPKEVLDYLAGHDELLDKVCDATGWDKDKILNLAKSNQNHNTNETESGSESEKDPTAEPSGTAEEGSGSESETETESGSESESGSEAESGSEEAASDSEDPTVSGTPTPAPSVTPLVPPTPAPDPTPIPSPTPIPNGGSENSLTPVPSLTPVSGVTSVPTNTPTPLAGPTNIPATITGATSVPTDIPTSVPSTTSIPSKTPTSVPSSTPVPTKAPTSVPSTTPIPTKEPTPIPTEAPTPTPKVYPQDLWFTEEAVFVHLGESLVLPLASSPDVFDAPVTWTITDPSIATVKNGTVTGVSLGEATVYASASTEEGEAIEAECIIYVISPPSVNLSPSSTGALYRDSAEVVADGVVSNFVNETIRLNISYDLVEYIDPNIYLDFNGCEYISLMNDTQPKITVNGLEGSGTFTLGISDQEHFPDEDHEKSYTIYVFLLDEYGNELIRKPLIVNLEV